jgi:hypothetical protein
MFSLCKVKVKFLSLINYALCYEDIWGSGGIAPPFFTSALDGSDQLHGPVALHQEKKKLYSLDRRLGGPQSGSGQEKIFPLEFFFAVDFAWGKKYVEVILESFIHLRQ